MKTLTLNNEVTTAANNVISYARGFSSQNANNFISPVTKFGNNVSFTDHAPANFKSLVTFARCRFFTIFLQAIEVFYIIYK